MQAGMLLFMQINFQIMDWGCSADGGETVIRERKYKIDLQGAFHRNQFSDHRVDCTPQARLVSVRKNCTTIIKKFYVTNQMEQSPSDFQGLYGRFSRNFHKPMGK